MRKTNVKKNLITQEGYDRLKKEYAERTTTVRKQIADKIDIARQDGDLSENSAYSEAMEAKSYNDSRVSELEEILSSTQIVQNKGNNNSVDMGDTVKVRLNGGEEIEYKIVGAQEANPTAKFISDQSPLGKALCDRKVGETVQLELPNGKTNTYEIVAIS